MKLIKQIGSVALLTVIASGALADDHAVRLGTEGAYAPFNFINDSGEIDGYEKDVGDELCKRAKLECTWVTNEWDSIIPNLVSGNYDAIIAGMSITEERDQVIDFTQQYFPPDPSSYVALTGASEDVLNGNIAAQTATIHASYISESGGTVVEFSTTDEMVAAVKNGEADAMLADSSFLADIIDASNGELAFIGDQVSIGGGVGMGIRESDTELKDKMNAAITSMKEDGTLSELIAKWFDGRVVKF